jgi:hypothetical protein
MAQPHRSQREQCRQYAAASRFCDALHPNVCGINCMRCCREWVSSFRHHTCTHTYTLLSAELPRRVKAVREGGGRSLGFQGTDTRYSTAGDSHPLFLNNHSYQNILEGGITTTKPPAKRMSLPAVPVVTRPQPLVVQKECHSCTKQIPQVRLRWSCSLGALLGI